MATAKIAPTKMVDTQLEDETPIGGRPTLAPDSKPNGTDMTTGLPMPTLTPTPQQTQPLTPIPATPQAAPGVSEVTPPSLQPMPVGNPQAQPQAGGFPMTDPNDPLTKRTIQRDPLVDRFNLAQDRFNTFVQSTDPQYQAALRQANRYGAATGRLGSGDLRTDFGNLAQQRDLQMRTAQNQFLQDALGGTIDDQFRDIGIAQQQQGFQAGQQQQAFENELRSLGFTEEMINSAFGRALQQYMAGQSGGTGSATGIAVGQSMQNQGSNALDELNKLIRGSAMPTMPTPQPITTPPWAGGARG